MSKIFSILMQQKCHNITQNSKKTCFWGKVRVYKVRNKKKL